METSITTRTKTTDLGKIVLTNGREYNPETTYEKNTFVLFRNSTYLALQTIVGVEPSNDLVNWQLMAKGFAGDDFVADRYVFVDRDEESEVAGEPMIDADALGGNKPDFYAPQHEISDQFSKEKDYDVGDYCIYLNRLYRFISAKPAGEWDGTAVIPVTIAEELQGIQDGVTKLNADLFGKIKIIKLSGVDLTKSIKNNISHGELKAFTFWNVTNNPFTTIETGYILAFYNRSLSPSVWLLGIQYDKIETSSI